MIYIIIALLLIGLLSPKPDTKKKKRKKEEHPWYDISWDDAFLYDLMDDD